MEIIRNLALGPRPVGQLAEETGQSIGLVSHNLRLLREANLVACTPRSRQRIYSLAPNVSVNYAKGMMDLRVHVAAEGNLALSIPTPTAKDLTARRGPFSVSSNHQHRSSPLWGKAIWGQPQACQRCLNRAKPRWVEF